jgi:hypothetical protein
MATYKFPMEHFYGVMVHVAAYKDMLVEAMSHDSVDYTIEVNIPIIPEEVVHLNENYSLVEVI